MIGLTQAFFGFSVARLLGLDERFAVVGALIPGVSLLMVYSGPLRYEGVFLSLTAAAFFSLIAAVRSVEASKGLFAGYCSSLFLESLTFSYIPVFYPFYGFQGLGLFSGFDPVFNLAVISVSIGILAGVNLKRETSAV